MAESVPILAYHAVSDDATNQFRPYAVPRARFAEHVAILQDLGCVTFTLSDAAQRLFDRERLPQRAVVLTFDDAFGDFAQHACPTLMAANFTATLFVPSAFIGATSRWLIREGEERRPVMSWSEIQSVAVAGIEVGAHSHTHPELDRLSKARLREELERSKTVLEDGLGREMAAVAYPFGYHSRRVRRAARAAGYTFGCAGGNLSAHSGSDRWAIPRLTVEGTADGAILRRFITGRTNRYDGVVSEAKRHAWRAWRAVSPTTPAAEHAAEG
jgi:peptidoglycan/xylan/chitin deacetylase (PgdA/CDA1 family)